MKISPTNKSLTLDNVFKCPVCLSMGRSANRFSYAIKNCNTCLGKGKIMMKQESEREYDWNLCPECEGQRHREVNVVEEGEEQTYLVSCDTCRGAGYVPSGVGVG